MKRALGCLSVVLAAGSCDPRTFDNLKDDAWIQIAERDDSQTSGDFAVDVIALDPPAEGGARFVITAGGPPGLAEATFGKSGTLSEQIGDDGASTGRGKLEPLDNMKDPTSIVPYDATSYIVGVRERNLVIKYEAGLKGGAAITPTGGGPVGAGYSVAVGNFKLGTAAPDVAVLGTLSVTMIPDGDVTKTPITCKMKSPDAVSSPVVRLQNLVVTKLDKNADHDLIVVSSFLLDNSSKILFMEPSSIQDGKNCPGLESDVAGTSLVVPSPPVAIAFGNLDDNELPEMVTGTPGAKGSGQSGALRIYFNITAANVGSAAAMDIPLSKNDEDVDDNDADASSAHAARLLIGDLDGNGKNELLVGDPGATAKGVSAAGRVHVYHIDSACAAGLQRGPACLARTLYDPDPGKNDYLGRAMTFATFKGKTTANIVAIAQRAKLFVYYRSLPTTADPRE